MAVMDGMSPSGCSFPSTWKYIDLYLCHSIYDWLISLHQLSLILRVIYGPFIWIIKLSLFLLYLETFGRLKWLRRLVYVGAILTGLIYFSSMIALIILCAPRDGQTEQSYLIALSSPRCALSKPLSIALGSVNIVSDFYILIIPLPAVWSLQLPIRSKIGVSAIILTGLM